MPLSKERLDYLFNAWSGNNATEAEEQELFVWVNQGGNHSLLLQHIQNLSEQIDNREQVSPFNEEIAIVNWERLYEQILENTAAKQVSIVRKMPWLRWSVAASIILLIGTGVYLYLNQPSSKKSTVFEIIQKPLTNDVPAPVTSKAVLTLADGRKIKLDSVGNGTLAQQGSVQVVKQNDGEITYKGTGSENLYNTLNVPRGGKVVTIKLSDGTVVWLNSESSLRYPASFSGNERKVEITGEAYFEVAHNPAKPFLVKKDAMEIKVLGTHFDINAYKDEGADKVTLLQGSIKITSGNHENLLKAGQQALVKDEIKLINGVDLEEVMAWKNGKFQFGDKADLLLVLKKIARWYDIDVTYEGRKIRQRFSGEIPMNSNLSQVLEILKTSGVKFTIDGKKVIVES